jgi:pre-mRNA-processing factor SLU7
MWGYACCHSAIHVSYCSGQAGIEAAKASSAQNLLSSSSVSMPPPQVPVAALSSDAEDRKKRAQQTYSKERLGEGDLELNDKRLAEALREEKKRKSKGDESHDRSGKRKKAGGYDVSEEQLGVFHCLVNRSLLLNFSRGVQDEPAARRGSDGELCGR